MNNNEFNANVSDYPATQHLQNSNICHKDVNLSQISEGEVNLDNLNKICDTFSDDETQPFFDSSNGISELEVRNDIYESLDNTNITQSSITFKKSNSLDDADRMPCNKQNNKIKNSNNFVPVVNKKECDHKQTINIGQCNISKNEEKLPTSYANILKGETYKDCSDDADKNVENSDLSADDEVEYEGSEDSNESNDGSVDLIDMYPNALKWQLRENNPQLPSTVTVLEAPGGCKVYLIGTAHFSIESQEDVAKTIRATQPDVVMVELCKSRMYILSQDENTILEEAKNINLAKIKATIQQCGVKQGILSLLLLSMCAHITKELGMAPGGEFRKAFHEARQIPQCFIQLGDRPIRITIERTLASLSIWQKIKIAWRLLRCRDPITKEDVERYKNKDLLEKLLSEMAGEFPELSQIMIQERDMYLAYSLRVAAKPKPSPICNNEESSTVVVGVVGMGHVPGIVENWETVSESDIPPILRIPEASRTSRIMKATIRYSIYGLAVYGIYRCTPASFWQKPISVVNRLWTR